MKIAITGGEGFIGTPTRRHAQMLGHVVFSLDRALSFDVLRQSDWDGLEHVDVVIHLAGMLGTAELFDSPHMAVRANVDGTLNALRWCAKSGAGYVGITMPDSSWANVYQATKLCAMRLASAWHRNLGVPVSHVRAFNVFGPNQKHGPGHPRKIIPTFATEAWAGRPIPVWGSGHQSVDLIHVDEVAQILVRAASFGSDQTFDAGMGVSTQVNTLADWINGRTGNAAGVEHLPMRPGETPDSDICATGEGWGLIERPARTSFWRQLGETIDWYRP